MSDKSKITEETKKDNKEGHAPSQHDGGVGNLQKEPKTAAEAEKDAAAGAKKK